MRVEDARRELKEFEKKLREAALRLEKSSVNQFKEGVGNGIFSELQDG
jgi:hypothetical protein